MSGASALSDDAWLESLQRSAFDYFPRYSSSHTGLVADNSRTHSPVSIAVVGFALAAYPIAVERGWITSAEAVQRVLLTLRFLCASDQSGSPTATGFRGFYYHFLDLESGTRVWKSELSMIDTALLIAGVLTAAAYFTADTPEQIELRESAQFLYNRVDWHWAQDGHETLRMGWKPESGFLHYGWEGYSEAILMYVLAMGSPEHPISGACYKAWTATYQWEHIYGHDCLYAGPLFVHQFSHAWIDFRGIRDDFMREKRSDYFENSLRAVSIQREYGKLNPNEFAAYDVNGWGLSACDGPVEAAPGAADAAWPLFGYAARGVPYGPDDGTLSPPAVLASLPFAPAPALAATRNLLLRYPQILSDGRLSTSVNPSLRNVAGDAWVSPGHYGLDQGILLLMIENHRSGQIWRMMRDCEAIRHGLGRAGFRGGWLQNVPHPEVD